MGRFDSLSSEPVECNTQRRFISCFQPSFTLKWIVLPIFRSTRWVAFSWLVVDSFARRSFLSLPFLLPMVIIQVSRNGNKDGAGFDGRLVSLTIFMMRGDIMAVKSCWACTFNAEAFGLGRYIFLCPWGQTICRDVAICRRPVLDRYYSHNGSFFISFST